MCYTFTNDVGKGLLKNSDTEKSLTLSDMPSSMCQPDLILTVSQTLDIIDGKHIILRNLSFLILILRDLLCDLHLWLLSLLEVSLSI